MARKLKDWLKGYLNYTQHTESPDVFHFCTGISTIASALRRRVWIDEIYFKWYPNFYIFLVSPPGRISKTTNIDLGSDLISQIKGIHIGDDVLTWQSMVQDFAKAKTLVKIPGEKGKLDEDGNEDVTEINRIPMCCITYSVGELGTFLDPTDVKMVQVLTDLWDGRAKGFKKGTKTQGKDTIENPWINIIAATTPAWLERNFPEHLVGGGLTSRVIFVYADKKRHLEPYPSDKVKVKVHEELKKELVEDLTEISKLFGQFTLTEEAKEWGREWYRAHWTKIPTHLASDRFGGYVARKQTHIHKLAMVLSVSKSDDLIIDLKTLQMAERFVTSLEVDMQKVFQSIGVPETTKFIQEILVHVRARGRMSKKDLWKICITVMPIKEFNDSIGAAIQAGFISQKQEGSDIYYYPIKQKKEKTAEVVKEEG